VKLLANEYTATYSFLMCIISAIVDECVYSVIIQSYEERYVRVFSLQYTIV
jgi:hypothetical protein